MNTLINPLRDSGQQSLGITEANRASLRETQTGAGQGSAEREAAGRGKGDFKSRTNPRILERRETEDLRCGGPWDRLWEAPHHSTYPLH